MNRSFCRFLLVLALTFWAVSSASQTSTLASLSKSPELQRLTRQAGRIFTGTVVAVTPIRGRDADQICSVKVTFQVEQALRGRDSSGLASAISVGTVAQITAIAPASCMATARNPRGSALAATCRLRSMALVFRQGAR